MSHQSNSSEKVQALPWKLFEDQRWPFGIHIDDASGACMVDARRMAYSTEQRDLSAVMQGLHMGNSAEQAAAARANAEQMESLRLIVRAVNNHDALIAALRALLAEITTPDALWIEGSPVNLARTAIQRATT